MKHLLLVSIIFTAIQFSFGQENVNLLYYQLPINLNPSLSGSGCGPRASVYYQRLNHNFIESSTYNRKGLNYDMPIVLKNKDKIGLGYKLGYDVAGSNYFTNLGNYISLAYHKSIGKNQNKPQNISIGLDAGIANTSFSKNNLRWPSQITPGGFDPDLPENEAYAISINYLDINLGIAWTGHINEKIKSTVGLAINHINKPNISFLGNSEIELKQRIVGHIGLDISINDKWSILPSGYYTSQNKADFYILNANISHHLNNTTSIELGGGFTKNEQAYVNAIFKYKMMNLGFAYGFKNSIGMNKMEMIFGYSFGNYNCK